MLDIAATCIVITALLAWANHRFVGLPTTIGVMAASLLLSLLLVALDGTGITHGLAGYERSLLGRIDFTEVLMDGMLSLLLFAGALHVDLAALRRHRLSVALLALMGTAVSAAIIGLATWWLLPWVGVALPLVHCLLFGALISPTDPVAVMGLVRSAGAPQDLETVIAGESLFNDGVGVVLVALLTGVLASGHVPAAGEALQLLLHEAVGGLAFGLGLGLLGFVLLRSVDQYEVEVLLTLAIVSGGYAAAGRLGVSGPLAMVAAGVVIGNAGRRLAMSDKTRRYVDGFWELIDEILNAVLFVLIGMEVVAIRFDLPRLAGAAVAVAVALAARALSVGLPVAALPRLFGLPPGSWRVLTWGGLRGGISVALALALPAGPERDTVVALTYGVVVFSILVQGMTIAGVTARALRRS